MYNLNYNADSLLNLRYMLARMFFRAITTTSSFKVQLTICVDRKLRLIISSSELRFFISVTPFVNTLVS